MFAKYAAGAVGAHDDIVLPAVSDKVDWEAELTVVIGRPVRHATPEQAAAAIAGYTVLNDVSVRDFQMPHQAVPAGQDVRALHAARAVAGHARTSCPAGGWEISTVLDGETMQRSTTDAAGVLAGRPDRATCRRSSPSTPAT